MNIDGIKLALLLIQMQMFGLESIKPGMEIDYKLSLLFQEKRKPISGGFKNC